ncbi:MAG: recombination mediator protein UvsY [Bacilli bacterium]|jgi:hypothetical protein
MGGMKPKEADFQIDPFRLDEEWVRQPNLYRRYAEASAEARRRHDEAKNDVTVIRSEIELAVRKNPEEHGLAKVTEGAIKTVIDLNEKVREAEEAVIEARYAMEVLQGAVGALDHRKAALGDLVRLHLADYFSKPTAPEEAREQVEEAGKRLARKSQRRSRDDD